MFLHGVKVYKMAIKTKEEYIEWMHMFHATLIQHYGGFPYGRVQASDRQRVAMRLHLLRNAIRAYEQDSLTNKPINMSGVTLNLTKGARVDLTKDNGGITKLVVGLGWDINTGNAGSFDLDSMAFHMKDGKLHSQNVPVPTNTAETMPSGIVFFGNKKIAGVELDKDNLTGEGSGDDEKMFVDLAAIPLEVTEVMIGVNIYGAATKHQNFGMINSAYMRIFNPETNEVYVKYDLTEDYSTSTAIKIAKIYRKDGEWKVLGVGEGTTGSVQDIANSLS